jgi:hypothetical protein
MRRAHIVLIAALMVCCAIPCVAAVSLEINATPVQAHIGDTITLTGKVSGLKTIADNRGVTLENLNIPAGRGLFTTAPVNLNDGTWEYVWDTSVILGTPKPGTYTINVVSTPVDRLRFAKGEYAATQVVFLPSETPANNVPFDPLVALFALISTSCAAFLIRQRKQD